ncbi:uncharacterized protein AB9W97_007749 isoform 1-T5 [Spinachia spinachia]
MDSTCCTPVKGFGTCCDAFYFEVGTAETAQSPSSPLRVPSTTEVSPKCSADVDEDRFNMSPMCLSHWFCSQDNKYLLLNTEGQFQVQNTTEFPHEKFQIQVYRDLDRTGGRSGRAVMLYMKNEGKKMVVCCDHKRAIYPRGMETLPADITSTKDAALFYMRGLSASNTFEFESSLYPSEFLGFEPSDNPSVHQLVLHKKKNEDENSLILLL